MSSEANAYKSIDPMTLLERGKEASRASFGLYHFWMKSARTAQRPWKTSLFDPIEAWKQWTDVTCDAWRVALETSTSVAGAFFRVNEDLFQCFQHPTRSDIARLEELVVSLEERVYTIEDAFVHFEDGYFKVTIDQVVEALGEYLERVEGKLDTLNALSSSTLQRTEMLEDLVGRLERVEDKLNSLLMALEKTQARAYPEATESGNASNMRHKKQKKRDETQLAKDPEREMR